MKLDLCFDYNASDKKQTEAKDYQRGFTTGSTIYFPSSPQPFNKEALFMGSNSCSA
jgi:hypothetical protein